MDDRRVYEKVPASWATMTDAEKTQWSALVLERLFLSGDPVPPSIGPSKDAPEG